MWEDPADDLVAIISGLTELEIENLLEEIIDCEADFQVDQKHVLDAFICSG